MKPVLYMAVGLPSSGKSHYAKKYCSDINIHSSDDIRVELFGNVDVQDKNDKVFNLLHKRVKEDLKSGRNSFIDATNITSNRRRAFLNDIRNIDCTKVCLVFATTIEYCKCSNKLREKSVPEYVIDRMYRNFEMPGMFEGWDKILVVSNEEDNYDNYNVEKVFAEAEGFNQKTPHHTHTLGEHLRRVGVQIFDDENLEIAGFLHDIGKMKTQVFVDASGNPSDVAHYYSHQNVGAYDSMILLRGYSSNDIVDICTLIQWHMKPYFWEFESTRAKYKDIWGEELYNRIMRLHEADKNAK